jgi:hypothetical protein
MAEPIILVSIAALGLWIMYGTAKAYQLHKFAAYMRTSINELYNCDKYKTISIDIDKSYKNMMKSPAWDYNFKDMITYANRS